MIGTPKTSQNNCKVQLLKGAQCNPMNTSAPIGLIIPTTLLYMGIMIGPLKLIVISSSGIPIDPICTRILLYTKILIDLFNEIILNPSRNIIIPFNLNVTPSWINPIGYIRLIIQPTSSNMIGPHSSIILPSSSDPSDRSNLYFNLTWAFSLDHYFGLIFPE